MFYSNLFEIEYQKKFPFVKISKRNLFSIFFISMVIAILAFLMETIVDYVSEYKIYDRGFLIGPFIPLYFFIVFIFLCIIKTPIYSLNSFIKSILLIGIGVSLIEFIVGNICELVFGVSLWYYKDSLPLSGKYVSVTVGFFWGILGTLLLFYVIPLLKKIADLITNKAKVVMVSLFSIVFISDLAVSLYLVINNDFKYKQLYGPMEGSIETTLFIISFILYLFCASTIAILLNIKNIKYKRLLYILFFSSELFPLFTIINFFAKFDNVVYKSISNIGYGIIYLYLLITLIITIINFISYKRKISH